MVRQIDADRSFEVSQAPDALQVVGNSVGEFEDIRSAFQAGPEVLLHFVPTAVVQFVAEHNEHTLFARHGSDEATNFLANVW